jgi:hypothetical protein
LALPTRAGIPPLWDVTALDPDMPQGLFLKPIKLLGTKVPPQLREEFE